MNGPIPPPPTPRRRWHRRQILLRGSAIATGAIALTWPILHQRQTTPSSPAAIAQKITQNRRFVAQGNAPLRDRAARRGLRFGAAANPTALANPDFAQAFRQECAILVPENELKWQTLRPQADQFNFGPADQLLAFARQHRISVRGHTLVWNQFMPDWFEATVTAANADQYLSEHIRRVMGRYRGQIESWDVVNEAVNGNPTAGSTGLQWSPWLDRLGPDYIELAFHRAAAADPKAQLVYNDARLEYDTEEGHRGREAVLRVLSRLKARQVPVHALGIQAHLNAAESRFNRSLYRDFLRRVANLGLKILITELDVSDRDLPADIPQRDRLVASAYQDFLEVALQEPAVTTVLTWGLSDRYTWLNDYATRPDKLPVRVLPLDAQMQRKPSWHAIAQSFDRAPSRP